MNTMASEPTTGLPIERIVATSDLSAFADLAITRSMVLAEHHGASLIIVHACAANETAEAERSLRDRAERIGAGDAEIDVRVGPPFVEIIRAAREVDADLIVTGAHGPSWHPLALTGSTAERVARKGDRPVLVVRQRAVTPYRRVVTAIDASQHAVEALEYALRLFDDADHSVVHGVKVLGTAKLRVIDPPGIRKLEDSALDAATDTIATLLEGVWTGGPAIIRYGDAAEVVADFATEWDADLVVAGTRGVGALPYVLLGSTAQRILRESPTDVMLVRHGPVAFELP